MITTIDEAFEIIDTTVTGVPFEAIDYLYNHEKDERIDAKILYVLQNVYNYPLWEVEDLKYYLSTPFWYGIVAEKHHSEAFCRALVDLYLVDDSDSDFMNEQGIILLEVHAQNYPNTLLPMAWNEIEVHTQADSDTMYYFLFNILKYLNLNDYKEKILNVAQRNFMHLEVYVFDVASLKISEAIPIFQKHIHRLSSLNDDYTPTIVSMLRNAIDILEGKDPETYEFVKMSALEMRGDWKEYLHKYESRFTQDDDVEMEYST